MTDINLPPLPENFGVHKIKLAYIEDQMRAYATAAVLADREARGAEPVAWVVKMPGGYHSLGYDSGVLNKVPHGTHLYAAPQPVEQRPLTDDQVLSLGPGQADAVWSYEDQIYFARAIETAHGIGKEDKA